MPRESLKVKPEFAEAVRDTLRKHGWSLRGAMVHTGLNHATIYNMSQGLVPSMHQVVIWAKSLDEPINKWLELAGYEPIPPALVAQPGRGERVPDEVLQAIEAAQTREQKVNVAFRYIRTDTSIRLGSSAMSRYPTEAKLDLVRMYERLTGKQILPPDLV